MAVAEPRRERADNRAISRRILDAALVEFAERGFHGTNIPSVLARAKVSASTLYRLYASKEALVNAVFCDAKGRLEVALQLGLDPTAAPRALFDGFWDRLRRFAHAEPLTFRFLELQDHIPYLDGDSRARELQVLMPIYLAVVEFQRRGVWKRDLAPETAIAFVWGAFVGLCKADRLGYFRLTDAMLDEARDAAWRAFAAPDHAAKKRGHHAND